MPTSNSHPGNTEDNDLLSSPAKGLPVSFHIDQSLSLLAAILRTAVDAIIVLDPNLKVILFNPAAEKMFHIDSAEIIGQPLDRFLPETLRGWHNEKIRSFVGNGETPQPMGLRHEIYGLRADGERFPIEASISLFESSGETFFTAILRDITDRVKAENDLRFLSTHDALTGVYNRLYFEEQLKRLQNSRVFPISLIFADIDGLKRVNDRFGHAKGDELIREAANLLKASFRAEDILARLGGDEFGVILPLTDEDLTLEAIERIYKSIGEHNQSLGTGSGEISISLGYATARKRQNLEMVLREADRRMYHHKSRKAHQRRES